MYDQFWSDQIKYSVILFVSSCLLHLKNERIFFCSCFFFVIPVQTNRSELIFFILLSSKFHISYMSTNWSKSIFCIVCFVYLCSWFVCLFVFHTYRKLINSQLIMNHSMWLNHNQVHYSMHSIREFTLPLYMQNISAVVYFLTTFIIFN